MTDPILIFIDAADDAGAYPASNLLGMTVAGDGTMLVKFGSSIGSGGTDGSAADIVTLTVTADTELTVFKAIAEAIEGARRNPSLGHVTICDDVNSVFAHPDILSCTLAIDS
tara:strand:+ start:139 stop:474 length:336 start_codon:yes stop_codon:yes gene_type:complete